MEDLKQARLMVCARGIEIWVRTLSERADAGDKEAERVLAKLRDAFEDACKLLGGEREEQGDEFVATYDGLLMLEEAANGKSEHPIELLRSIAEQVQKDLQRLGCGPIDTSFLHEPGG